MTAAFSPDSHEMLSVESHPLGFDARLVLQAGETITAPQAQLLDAGTGQSYPGGLVGPPTVSGTVITQRVANLQPGHTYWLIVSFTASGGTVWGGFLTIRCPH